MSSIIYQPLKINGVLSTDKSALQNLNDLCSASGAFLTFDISQGKWAVVINNVGTSIYSFNDSNIIGSINVSETGVSELYNSASVEFSHRTLRDQTDFVDITVDPADRYPNEVDNNLNIQSTIINDPIQAQYIGSIELKQSRLNRIITFTTDYTSLGLKAGDLIDVTSDMYGYNSKIFRIIKIEENDEDTIGINITGLEYSDDVYNADGLSANERTKKTGILLKEQNEAVKAGDDASSADQLMRMLIGNVGLGLINSLLNKLLKKEVIDGRPTGKLVPNGEEGEEADKLLSGAKKPTLTSISGPDTKCDGQQITISVGHTCSSCLFDIPDFDYDYTIEGVDADKLDVADTGKVTVSGGNGLLSFTVFDVTAPYETVLVTIGGITHSVDVYAALDYTYSVAADKTSMTEGETVVVTLTTTGSKLNASIPYTISGTATSRVSSPSLTGSVTAVSGSATLTIVTTNDAVYQGTKDLVVTFEPDLVDPCETVGTKTISVTVLDNDTAPPPNTNCVYVLVPAVWCGEFSGSTNALIGISVRHSISLPVPQAGEASVFIPYACSVSGGSIVVDEEIEVAAASVNCGGIPVRIITSFNSVANNGIITGTTTTLYGY